VIDRGYAVSEVAERLGISTKSLYTWKARLSEPAKEAKIDTGQSREIRRLKAELIRVTEERDILKKATVYFAKDAK
jgi:transposase